MRPLTRSAPQTDYRARFRDLVFSETGIRMPANKDHLIVTRLRRRLLEGGFSDLDDYFEHLFDGGALHDEWPLIIDKITTNKTDFFREPAHYELLAKRVIPEAMRASERRHPCRFRLWSAASSTGAEAYSAAMILAEAAGTDGQLDWTILGTDISTRVLDEAMRAIYPCDQLDPVPQDLRARYTMPGRGTKGGTGVARIVPELRRRVRFGELNLIDPPYPVSHGLDVIMLRNVLIYFTEAQQQQVIANIVGHLAIGGWFFVGHAESMIVQDHKLAQIAPATFRRKGD